MDTSKTLDLTGAADYEIAAIRSGYEMFVNGKGIRYFGAVLNKKDLKNLNRTFNYIDTHSWISGALFGAGVITIYEAYKRSKTKNTKKEDK